MLVGFFLFSAADAQAKFLTETLNPIQIVWARYFGLLAGGLIFFGIEGPAVLRTTRPLIQILRGTCAAASATCFVIAVAFVPLADAVAVAFVAPFMVTIMGALILGEPVGIRRWIAVVIGFLGAMVVIRPGLGVVHPAAMLVMLAAALFAVRQIISRYIADTDRTSTTVVYTALTGAGIMTVPLLFVWQWPETRVEIALLLGIAASGAVGEMFVIRALQMTHAVILAPLQYTMLLWGIVYGYVIFSDLPDRWTLVGALIIIATGLYTLHRERVVARQRRAS